ncbi:PEP-CTERM sorting domain-containing protein [Pelomonas sp. KK5]|uniref:PEP-CTERM sorting domain-containing protein n=1 Tax=Pelomonas sp. KK5 TaxID=1855730 RepID=UPI0009F82EA0|nr:PEP-CTERM sorting domain-containing protein [Pelomonas sp. KK5]
MQVRAAMLRTTIAAALLSALVVPAGAVTQASLSLSDFGYTLKDLNTGDAVTPALSWVGAATVSGSSSGSTQQGWAQSGGWMSADWQQSSYASAWSTLQLNGGSAQGLSQYSGATAGGVLNALSVSDSVTAGLQDNTGISYDRNFTLTPGSQVTFSYVLNGGLSGDSAAGLWMPPSATYGDNHSSAQFSSTISAGSVSNSLNSNASNTWEGWGGSFGSTSAYETVLDGQTLTLTLRNTDSVAKTYDLSIAVRVWSSETAAPVPEPGSYALMALGLVAVIGAAAKRRRG